MREGNLNQFQKLELVQTKASNHNVIKQEFNNKIKKSEVPTPWILMTIS